MKITDEEYNQIIAEMTKRLRDIMYIYSDKKLRKEIPKKLAEELLEGEGILEITYDFHFAVAFVHLGWLFACVNPENSISLVAGLVFLSLCIYVHRS